MDLMPCAKQLPQNYEGPCFTRVRGVESGYFPDVDLHGVTLGTSVYSHPNVYAETFCAWQKKGSFLADCPAKITAGFNWLDLRNPAQTWFPVLFYGKSVKQKSTVGSRSIEACVHPFSVRPPLESRYDLAFSTSLSLVFPILPYYALTSLYSAHIPSCSAHISPLLLKFSPLRNKRTD